MSLRMRKTGIQRFWYSRRRSSSSRCAIFLVWIFAGSAVLSLAIIAHGVDVKPRIKELQEGIAYSINCLRAAEEDRLQSALVSPMKSITGYSLKIEGCGEEASLAAPWLLEPQSKCLPYYGKTNLTTLAEFQAKRIGRYERAISVIFFSASLSEVTQNAIFSMVKFGGASNFIVACWNSFDLAACQNLNLPCADASSYLSSDLKQNEVNGINTSQVGTFTPGWGAEFGSIDYRTIVWAKPAVVLDLLNLGYVVHSSDVDLAYGPKDIWESYMAYIESVGADGAFQLEDSLSPVNTGNFVILPTDESKSFMRAWINESTSSIQKGGNQIPLAKMRSNGIFDLCETLPSCAETQIKIKSRFVNHSDISIDGMPAVFRIYRPPWWGHGASQVCRLSGGERIPPIVDPCHPMLMFVHPVCAEHRSSKLEVIQKMGFWYMKEDQEFLDSTVAGCPVHAQTNIPHCKPREDAGAGFEKCTSRLAFSGNLW